MAVQIEAVLFTAKRADSRKGQRKMSFPFIFIPFQTIDFFGWKIKPEIFTTKRACSQREQPPFQVEAILPRTL